MCCNKKYQYKFDEKLKEQFFNACTFYNHIYNKFILVFQKDVYPYEYMDDWEKPNEISLPEKRFLQEIANADYVHSKRDCKDFEIKNLGEYHGLHVPSDTILLSDVFENLRNMS